MKREEPNKHFLEITRTVRRKYFKDRFSSVLYRINACDAFGTFSYFENTY